MRWFILKYTVSVPCDGVRSVLGAELRIHTVQSMKEGSIFIFSLSVRGYPGGLWGFTWMQKSVAVTLGQVSFLSFIASWDQK